MQNVSVAYMIPMVSHQFFQGSVFYSHMHLRQNEIYLYLYITSQDRVCQVIYLQFYIAFFWNSYIIVLKLHYTAKKGAHDGSPIC